MSRFVVCYDIADDRRRNAIARMLDAYGDRIQESIFELPVDANRLQECLDNIMERFVPTEDGLIVYALCGSCDDKAQYFGSSATESRIGGEHVFIV